MRQGTWQGIDHGRSDPVPAGEPTAAWATYALNAPVMLVDSTAARLRPVTARVSFAALAAGPGAVRSPARRWPTSTTT